MHFFFPVTFCYYKPFSFSFSFYSCLCTYGSGLGEAHGLGGSLARAGQTREAGGSLQ